MAIHCWQMIEPGRPLTLEKHEVQALEAGQVLVKVAGCGVCHTDLGFFYGGVKTRHALPLTLGHEISGTVIEAGPGTEKLLGCPVIVPAVLPCGECDACLARKGTICPRQIMPGNDLDGGFASHVVVPARFLCPLNGVSAQDLPDWSVVADAVSTPFQAVRRAQLQPGDFAVFVGVGGVGSFGVQIASDIAIVAALDIDDDRLHQISRYGAAFTLNVRTLEPRAVKTALQDFCRERQMPARSWIIFETSGTRAGQELAFSLLVPDATLMVVGFTMDKVNLRLSNLMALDARAIGTWGCAPELYPEVVQWVKNGKIRLTDFIERHPLSSVNDVLERAHRGEFKHRPVLVPE